MTEQPRDVRVIQARLESAGVVSLTLAPTDGKPLPEWAPGAHLDLMLPSGTVRQYSLCGGPHADTYTVAVLREQAGRGGSAEVHDTALVGRTVQIRGPRNHFELEPAPSYVFVAGGIGITPILAMIRTVEARGQTWTLHYGGRSAESLAFTDEVRKLADGQHGELHLYTDDVDGPLPLRGIITSAAPDAALYACGPAGMLTALTEAVEQETPELRFRLERFTAAPAATAEAAEADWPDGTASFEVELAQTGETVTVEAGQSILDAVREKRPEILSSCEEGFCGTCETKVLDGRPIHRDSILSKKERAKNTSMMICVGGCASSRLVLDL